MSKKIRDNYNVRIKQPLDNRSVVDSVNTIDRPYEGLITYEKNTEDLKLYDKNGNFISIYKDILNNGFANVKLYGAKGDGVTDDTQFFNTAIGSGKTVFIPRGNYNITAPTEQGNFILEQGAKIIGLPDINSNGSLMNDTSRLTGTVFNMNVNKDLYGYRLGDSDAWLERDIRKATEIISTLSVLSNNGQIGLLSASRTSDNPTPNMACIGHASYGINDNIINPENSWALYLESRRSIGAGSTFNAELDFVNYGETVDVNPYTNVGTETGATVSMWGSCGGGIDESNNMSAFMCLIPNPKKFKRGIVFKNGSLDENLNESISMPFNYNIAWYRNGGLQSFINGTQTVKRMFSDTPSDCVLDNWYKNNISNGNTSSLDMIKRNNYFATRDASDFLSGYTQCLQRTPFINGNARFSYDINVKNSTGGDLQITLGGVDENTFSAGVDNAINLGAPSARWSNIYCGTATINTSDSNSKQDITLIDNDLILAFQSIEPKVFRFKDSVADKGENARIHMGYIAQDLQQALINNGINPSKYAIWCEDEISNIIKDSDGNIIDVVKSGTYRQGLRYEHFIALMDASNRKKFEDIERRLSLLENR